MPIAALIVSILSALGNARNPDDSQIQQRNQLASSIFGLVNNSSRNNGGIATQLRKGMEF